RNNIINIISIHLPHDTTGATCSGAGRTAARRMFRSIAMSRRLVIVLLCGSIAVTLSMGVRQGFGLFLPPVELDLETSRALFGLVVGVQNLLWGLTQPFAGLIADRFGAARVVLVGGLLYVAGLALAAVSSGIGTWGLGAGVLIGVAQSGTAYAVVLGAIGRAAPPEHRSTALG